MSEKSNPSKSSGSSRSGNRRRPNNRNRRRRATAPKRVLPAMDDAEKFDQKRDGKVSDFVYYCRNCERPLDYIEHVEIIRIPKKGEKLQCKICKKEKILFGSEKSVLGYFRLKEFKVVDEAENISKTEAK